MDPNPGLDESAARVQDPVRRPHPRLTITTPTQISGRSQLVLLLRKRQSRKGVTTARDTDFWYPTIREHETSRRRVGRPRCQQLPRRLTIPMERPGLARTRVLRGAGHGWFDGHVGRGWSATVTGNDPGVSDRVLVLALIVSCRHTPSSYWRREGRASSQTPRVARARLRARPSVKRDRA